MEELEAKFNDINKYRLLAISLLKAKLELSKGENKKIATQDELVTIIGRIKMKQCVLSKDGDYFYDFDQIVCPVSSVNLDKKRLIFIKKEEIVKTTLEYYENNNKYIFIIDENYLSYRVETPNYTLFHSINKGLNYVSYKDKDVDIKLCLETKTLVDFNNNICRNIYGFEEELIESAYNDILNTNAKTRKFN